MKYKLSDLAEVGSSKRIYAKEYQASGIPFYRGKEIIAKSEGRKVENSLFISEDRYNCLLKEYSVPKVNDILISAVGTIGKIYLVNKDDVPFYFKDGNLIRIYNYNSKLVDPYYMYYLLKSKCGQNAIKEIEIGSTQKAITIKEFSNIAFDIPSLKEQQEISYKFKRFDSQININSKINDNLANIKTTIFNHMFDAHIKNNLNGTLQDIAEIKTGKRPNTKYDTKKENFIYPVVGASKIMGYTNKFLYDESIITTGRVGTHGIVQRYREPVWVSDNSFILRSKHEDYLFELLHNYINYDALNTGSTQPLITQSNLKNVNIFIPSKEKLTLFEQRVVPLTDQQFKIKDQNNILHELKLQLLSKYF